MNTLTEWQRILKEGTCPCCFERFRGPAVLWRHIGSAEDREHALTSALLWPTAFPKLRRRPAYPLSRLQEPPSTEELEAQRKLLVRDADPDPFKD